MLFLMKGDCIDEIQGANRYNCFQYGKILITQYDSSTFEVIYMTVRGFSRKK